MRRRQRRGGGAQRRWRRPVVDPFCDETCVLRAKQDDDALDSEISPRGRKRRRRNCGPTSSAQRRAERRRHDGIGGRLNSSLCTLTVTYPAWYVRVMEAALRALADESRRTMLETLAGGPATAGELAALLPIARPGVSRHLRVLRQAGLVEVRQQAQRRIYSLRLEPLAEVDRWLGRYRDLWEQRLDALHTEVARGKRGRRNTG